MTELSSDGRQAGYKQRDTEDEADARSFAKSEAITRRPVFIMVARIAYGLRCFSGRVD